MIRPRPLALLAALLLAVLPAAGAPAAAEGEAAAPPARATLVAYTALELEQLGPMKAAIEAAVPEVEIAWVRAATGIITDRFLAEGRALKADLFLGIAVSSLLQLKDRGLLAPYRPRGAEALRSFFRDPTEPYSWTGMDAFLGIVCFNRAAAREAEAFAPVRWADLLAPAFRGRIAMPNPVESGTGYLLLAGWLQSMGEEAGWAYVDALDRNVARYLPSGSAPCVEAAAGRAVAGLSFDMRGAAEKAAGAPIDLLVPIDGTGWDEEAVAIAATTAHRALAERVMDWAASRAASELYARSYAIVAHPAITNPAPDYPAHAEARMIRNDVVWMARNRGRILAEWTRRYGARAAAP